MRFLGDENVESGVVGWLRNDGHGVCWAAERLPAATDEDLVRLAQSEERILIIHDLDFGKPIFRQGRLAAGILLLRFRRQSESDRVGLLRRRRETIAGRGRFVVVADRGVRIRPL